MNPEIHRLAKILWDYQHLAQKLEKSDAILVLCSKDTRTGEHGADLFLAGWAPLLIFSGNAGRLTSGMWDVTEAEKFAETAIERGVPADKILLEKEATNTGENLQFSRKLLEEKNIDVKRLIAVQKPYMERRTYATFKKQWPEMDFIISSPDISYDEYPNEIITRDEMLNTMVGDLQRIKEYPSRGFQIPQEIPDEVWSAYEQLIAAGYTKQLIKE